MNRNLKLSDNSHHSVRLKKGELNTSDILSAALANTAPAMSFFFSFGAIAIASGLGSPFAIAMAGVVVLLTVNSLIEFTKVIPSTGSYISYIGRTFGGIAGTMTALALTFGFIVAVSYVMAILGGWTSIMLKKFAGIHIPWQIIAIILVAFVGYLVIRGVKISTKWAVATFIFELALILISAIIMLAVNGGHISWKAFDPTHIKNGISGLGLAFPLAVFMFLGVGNPSPMVEETRNPRRSVPIAMFTSTIFITVLYIFMALATTTAFNGNMKALDHAPVPFVDAGLRTMGGAIILVYLAGFTSTFASLIGATNGQARMIFSAAREGLLPKALAKTGKSQTPWSSIVFYMVCALLITLIWGTIDTPLNAAGLVATLGTIPIALVFLVLNIALPVFYIRYHRDRLRIWRHIIFPILGVLTMILPFWGLVQPGQPAPFNIFPYIVLAYLVLSAIYSIILNRRHPDLRERVGSIIADE